MLSRNKTYSNTSQVLQRNESLFYNKNMLIAGNIDDDYPLHLEELANSATFCFSDYRYYSALHNKFKNSESYFTDHYQGGTKNRAKFDLLLILM